MEIKGVSKEKHHFLPFSCKVLLNFSLKSDVRSGVQGSLFAINVGLEWCFTAVNMRDVNGEFF